MTASGKILSLNFLFSLLCSLLLFFFFEKPTWILFIFPLPHWHHSHHLLSYIRQRRAGWGMRMFSDVVSALLFTPFYDGLQGSPYPNLSDATDCSLPGSSVHGIFQGRVLEWGLTVCCQANPRNTLGKVGWLKSMVIFLFDSYWSQSIWISV